jgi:hypothetical protein
MLAIVAWGRQSNARAQIVTEASHRCPLFFFFFPAPFSPQSTNPQRAPCSPPSSGRGGKALAQASREEIQGPFKCSGSPISLMGRDGVGCGIFLNLRPPPRLADFWAPFPIKKINKVYKKKESIIVAHYQSLFTRLCTNTKPF